MLYRLPQALAVLLIAASGSQYASPQAPTNVDKNVNKPLLQQLSPSIVRRLFRSGPHQTGVIISEQGHILTLRHASPGTIEEFVLSGGERVTARALGFSDEWKIGLYKLDDKRPWVPVRFGSEKEITVGAKVVNVGFVQPEYDKFPDDPIEKTRLKQRRFEQTDAKYPDSPVLKPSAIIDAHPDLWFSARQEGGVPDFGMCTFTQDGKLLGLVTASDAHYYASTSVEIIRRLLPGLMESQNLDWSRFPPKPGTFFHKLAPKNELRNLGIVAAKDFPSWSTKEAQFDFQQARATAKATTVRLRRMEAKREHGESWSWSGVVVSEDGYVVTCAHTRQSAGDAVNVVFDDGIDAPAKVIATNPISDIGIVKIDGEGRWPFAKMTSSAQMLPGDRALHVGYPAPQSKDAEVAADLVILDLKVVRTPYIVWSPDLFFELSMEIRGGMSGGGVFDQRGDLIGLLTGVGGISRIEVVKAQWEDLID